ncbi:class I SAM-dependent methyltransferase [Chitinophaga silvisoli]|uniref:Class I SAM-dependent methyltransferase n=1 Tax=Chitinophaga silvisoli TaxID=2291814 RepID=A0A3E1P9E0_9BACT|nr:methyltransferase domain-containing protein [Chitinophaga silvisoli]RFM36774.1 class I SAM-dependent methyltransferase [Chitinophaga silvisoli]
MKTSTSYERAAMPEGTASVLDTRTIENANANLLAVLKPGHSVLDVGCGSGTITKGIAKYAGKVTGLDRSEALISLAKVNPGGVTFIVGDIMDYNPNEKFDIITTARTLQWIAQPRDVINKMVSLLKPGGLLCVLDYNHEAIRWDPAPPQSMLDFYAAFLKWRADAGMDNAIADHVIDLVHVKALKMTVEQQDEYAERGMEGFDTHISLWKKVAETRGNQLVADGYITEAARLRAIEEYDVWAKEEARSMRLYLKATHATF